MIEDGGILYSQIDSQLPGFVQTDHTKFSKFIEKYYEFLELNLITFTDLDLNEDAILQEKANTTYSVTVATGNNAYSNSANKFYVDGEVSPTITLTSGSYAIFDQGDETNSGHYFHISKTPDGIHTASGTQFTTDDRGDVLFTYEGIPADYDNVTLEDGSGILLYEDEQDIGLEIAATASFYVSPDLAGETLYYYCNNHSGMGGNITVSTVTAWISQENGNTDSANTSTTDYIAVESPSRQGDQFLSGETLLGITSGATGKVKGKYSTTQAYVEETNNGSFQVGESIKGTTSRATATVNSYSRQPINASRNVKSFQDIDKAPAGFVELFRKEFLTGFTKNADISTPNLLKNIKDFYRSKGNENSFRYIFRLLFGIEDVEFYYPGKDMLRLSDGRWTLDNSIKILSESATFTSSFLGRTIVGGTSNVSALVERIERYQVGSLDVTELFLSQFDANNASYQATADANYTTFFLGETLTTTSSDDDGNYASATTSGVLQGVDILYGGSGYEKGEELRVTGGGGTGAKAKVGTIAAAALTGIAVIDSGDGYTVGDVVEFTNDGTGGTGGSARVDSVTKTVNVFTQTEVISTQSSTTINAAAFAAPWGSYNRNTHISSNSTTTFTVPFDGLSGTTPKQGDFIAEFGSGESITLYTTGTSKFGTVISTNSTSITYGLGSIDYPTTYNATPTLNNFADDDAITIFDLSLDEDGAAVTSNGHNSTFRVTGASFNINGTPTANTDTTYHGAATMQESEIGGVRSLQIMSSGQGYASIPPVSVANTEITSYGGVAEKVGANSIFVNLANTIANTFTANTLIKNSTNNAFGIVLDFLDLASTTLADTGNTTLRIQMTSANTFSSNDILTSYNRITSTPTGIGDFGTANISTSGTTATFTQADHGFGAGDRIVITGSESGTDAAVYNNNHTIAGITNSSTYTVTLASDPTDDSETSLTVRKIVTANVIADLILSEDSTTTQLSFENGVGTANDDYSSSTSNGSIIVESGIDEANATFANTGIPGNNAVIAVAELAVGAIESVLVYDFGAGYSGTPTISAAAVGDGSATLTGNVGVYAEYPGYFDGEFGLLSGTNKMQDNLYYQDFSYVVKTNTDVATYRDKILELVHPAGMALFGEIVVTSDVSVALFDNATNNINSTQANTAQVANSVNVSLYNTHEVEFCTFNCAANNQVTVEKSYELKSFSTEITIVAEFDVNMDTTGSSSDFDLQLEHGNDLFSLQVSGFFLAFENSGELLLEIDIDGGVGDRLIEETVDFLLTEDESPIIYDFFEAQSGSVISEDGDGIEIDFTNVDTLQMEESTGDFIVADGVAGATTFSFEDIRGEFLLDEVTLTGGPIGFENKDGTDDAGYSTSQSSGTVLLNSTDGAPGTDDGDQLVSEDYTFEVEGGFLSNEDSDQFGIGTYIVEEDAPAVLTDGVWYHYFSQGGKLQQEDFHYVTAVGNLIQEDDIFVLLEIQSTLPSTLGLESATPDAFAGLQETVYVELENSIGGDSAVRSDNISHFVYEDDDTDTVQVRNEDEASNFKLEDFESALVLEQLDSIQLEGSSEDLLITEDYYQIQLEQADTETASLSFFIFEDDDSDARAYLMEEPITVTYQLHSEDQSDLFNIRMNDTDDIIILEVEEFITDTNFKGESYDTGTGFLLPMLLFPTPSSGSAKLDLSFTSNIVLEIDDIDNVRLEDQDGSLLYEDFGVIFYERQPTISVGFQYDLLLLEESDGTNPVYIATETSMTEEIDTLREIDIIPDGNYQLILETEFGSHENAFLIFEGGGITLESGTDSEGVIRFEAGTFDGGRPILEEGVGGGKIDLVQPHVAASVRVTHPLTHTGDTLNQGSFLTTGIGNRKYGSVSISELSSEFELTTENGISFLSEQSTSRKDNLITEAYNRGVVVTGVGTDTQFEFDFNNLIVLESQTALLYVILLEDEPGNILTETNDDFLLESSKTEFQNGVIELEHDTPEENSIIQESDDPDVFELIQQEDGSKIFTEEDIHQLISAPERLCGVGLHDLILEEEGILQEAVDQIKLEDFTLDNITQEELILGQFVPFLGFEPHDEATDFEAPVSADDNMLLESITHKTENIIIVGEDGSLIGQEEDETSHIVTEDFYFKYYSEGTITQIGTVITLSGGLFPSLVTASGRFFYQNGVDSTAIVSVSFSGRELTVENSTLIGVSENYRVEYSLDLTPATVNARIVLEAFSLDTTTELVRTDTIFNGAGDFQHGFTRGEDSDGLGTYSLSIAAFADIIGNDIVYEDGERILTEDGVGGYIVFDNLLEASGLSEDMGPDHGKVLNEDNTGGFFTTEDFEAQTDQDDNVLMKEMSDGLLLEDSEGETLNYVLSEELGQMMLEDVFQVSEYKIVLDSNDSILVEDQPDGDNWNVKLLNMDMGRFDISEIVNNTSLEIQTADSSTSSADFFRRSDSAILVSRTEQIV